MKILILSISALGILLTTYIVTNLLIYATNLGDWLYFSIALTLLAISIIGVVLNFEGIKIYRNRVRFM